MALDWRKVTDELVHPTVVDILLMCERSVHSPKQMAEAMGAPLPQVSYHVRRLADAGLLELVDTIPRRGALEHFYRAGGCVRRRRAA
jgi:DNA-binding transcriptional ArsR family regulator